MKNWELLEILTHDDYELQQFFDIAKNHDVYRCKFVESDWLEAEFLYGAAGRGSLAITTWIYVCSIIVRQVVTIDPLGDEIPQLRDSRKFSIRICGHEKSSWSRTKNRSMERCRYRH